jgi:hypothetical protein
MALPSVVTIAVPSYNQGHFLEDALNSIFEQNLPVEIGSSAESVGGFWLR